MAGAFFKMGTQFRAHGFEEAVGGCGLLDLLLLAHSLRGAPVHALEARGVAHDVGSPA